MDWLLVGKVPRGVLHSTDTGTVPVSTVQLRFSESLWLMRDGAEIVICGGSGEERKSRGEEEERKRRYKLLCAVNITCITE